MDIPKALLAFAILVGGMTFIGVQCAKAERPINGAFPTGAVAFIGIDDDFDYLGGDSGNPFCHSDNHHTGVFGARVPLYRWDETHTIVANLEHNSCLQEERDLNSDNRIGIRYEFRAW